MPSWAPTPHHPKNPMPELRGLHLPDTYLHMVQAVLRQHAPEATVWAYGSRVNGDHHEASDLDLVLRHPSATPCPPGQLNALREAFSDSNLPLLVQLVDWVRIPAAFQAEIEAGYVVVQSGTDVRHDPLRQQPVK